MTRERMRAGAGALLLLLLAAAFAAAWMAARGEPPCGWEIFRP